MLLLYLTTLLDTKDMSGRYSGSRAHARTSSVVARVGMVGKTELFVNNTVVGQTLAAQMHKQY